MTLYNLYWFHTKIKAFDDNEKENERAKEVLAKMESLENVIDQKLGFYMSYPNNGVPKSTFASSATL